MTTHEEKAPQLTWANIIITIAVVMTMCGGAWVLFQSQFSAMREQFVASDNYQMKQLDALSKVVEHNTFNSVSRPEHTELVKRIDGQLNELQERLKIIETTRPTTGELQGISTGTKEQLSEIKSRVQSLEDNLRRAQPLAPVTPPAPAAAR
jgi:archaellum component FlaC